MHTRNVSLLAITNTPVLQTAAMQEYLPNIVQHQALSVVEAGPHLPLLPLDQIALQLHSHTVLVRASFAYL